MKTGLRNDNTGQRPRHSYQSKREFSMRFRTILLVVAILLLAGFVALNVDVFTQPNPLSLGFTTINVPLGLVMLGLLLATLIVFLGSTIYMQSRHVLEGRTHTRELNAQRELADKAEASRFTELRSYLEAQAVTEQHRETALGTVMADRFAQQQQVLLARMEQMDNTLAAYMGELEQRLGQRASTINLPHDSNTTFR
ncbi:hypothetical protein [Polaromonas sp. CG9_12]|nr:hypothetical protein [Polaromonas sp. CG9_12]